MIYISRMIIKRKMSVPKDHPVQSHGLGDVHNISSPDPLIYLVLSRYTDLLKHSILLICSLFCARAYYLSAAAYFSENYCSWSWPFLFWLVVRLSLLPWLGVRSWVGFGKNFCQFSLWFLCMFFPIFFLILVILLRDCVLFSFAIFLV